MPRVIFSSPDQKPLLRLEPAPDVQRWNLQHIAEGDRPAWYASFGARTPVEIIAALTNPAARPAADAYEPLGDSDWVPVLGNKGLVSPDGTARVERFVSRTTDC